MRKEFLASGVLAAGLLALPCAGLASTMYVHDSSGNLGTVDTGTGDVNVIGNMGSIMTDIAFDTTGNLYGMTFSSFYSIDPSTAASSRIGDHGISVGNALVFDTDGTLYSAGGGTTNLYTIDPSSGASTSLGSMGFASGGDLAFVGDEFYLADTSSSLVSVDLDDLSASSRVGSFGVPNVYGIATDEEDVMFGVGGTEIFTVDTATGGAVESIDFGGQGLGNANGQSFFGEAGAPETPGTGPDPVTPDVAAVPLPAPALLLLAGLGMAGTLRIRRRA